MLGISCWMAYQKVRRAHTVALLFLFLKLFFKQGHLNLVTDYLLLIFYYSPIVTCSFLYFRNQIKRVHSLIFVAVDHIQRSK